MTQTITNTFHAVKAGLIVAIVAFLLASCSEKNNTVVEIRPLSELYNKGILALKAGDEEKAIELFKELQTLYPYSQWSGRAQLLSAYAYFLDEEYDDALYELEGYIELYPLSDYVDYAMYLRAVSYFEQITIFERDQRITELAYSSLLALINSFPSDNKYARDSYYKLALVENHLAGKELDTGRYYLRRSKFTSALGRFNTVLREFPGTVHVPETMYRMVETYLILGLDEEAKTMMSLLAENYIQSKWYGYGYELLKKYKLI